MKIEIFNNYEALSRAAAKIFIELLKNKQKTVVGLPAGKTPKGMYKRLVELYEKRSIDLSNVVTFNLDEYLGLDKDHPQSFQRYMRREFLDKVNIEKENSHFPSVPGKNYEEKIREEGGLDLVYLGIGINGHIGFNEPPADFNSVTRKICLSDATINYNRKFFKNEIEAPRYAITMGIATIMSAKKCVLMASGKTKARIIKEALQGPVTENIPASILQTHPDLTVLLDEGAALELG